MKIADSMVAQFTHESAGTRKMLQRLPEQRLSWRPHARSMSMGELATHIAHVPGWSRTILNDRDLDVSAGSFRVEERTRRDDVLALFEKNLADFQKLLSGRSDEQLFQMWALKRDGEVVLELPRVACLRAFIMSHVIHHRGQLTVYYRENDVPLPALYGPSAGREKKFGFDDCTLLESLDSARMFPRPFFPTSADEAM